MVKITPNYGAITEIIDERTSYTVKDSTDTEFIFEICPIHITSEEINKTLEDMNLTNIWFIDYKLDFKPPTESDIERALKEGIILKIYFTAAIIDNYGYLHSIQYNENEKKYNIIFNKTIVYLLNNNNKLYPYSDDFIDIIKTVSTPKLFIGLPPIDKFLFGHILCELNKSNQIIKQLEERIKVLEQK